MKKLILGLITVGMVSSAFAYKEVQISSICTGFKSCKLEVNPKKNSGFSPQYVGAIAHTTDEAITLNTQAAVNSYHLVDIKNTTNTVQRYTYLIRLTSGRAQYVNSWQVDMNPGDHLRKDFNSYAVAYWEVPGVFAKDAVTSIFGAEAVANESHAQVLVR